MGILDMLQYAAGALDKPGAAVRGLLAGKPEHLAHLIPFSDTIGITRPEDRMTGRDLIEHYGLVRANRPGLDWGDVAGFGVDMLTDPLSYLALPTGKAASTMGRTVYHAADDMFDMPAKIANAFPVPPVPKRTISDDTIAGILLGMDDTPPSGVLPDIVSDYARLTNAVGGDLYDPRTLGLVLDWYLTDGGSEIDPLFVTSMLDRIRQTDPDLFELFTAPGSLAAAHSMPLPGTQDYILSKLRSASNLGDERKLRSALAKEYPDAALPPDSIETHNTLMYGKLWNDAQGAIDNRDLAKAEELLQDMANNPLWQEMKPQELIDKVRESRINQELSRANTIGQERNILQALRQKYGESASLPPDTLRRQLEDEVLDAKRDVIAAMNAGQFNHAKKMLNKFLKQYPHLADLEGWKKLKSLINKKQKPE